MKHNKHKLLQSNSLESLQNQVTELEKKGFDVITINMHLWGEKPEQYYFVCMKKEVDEE